MKLLLYLQLTKQLSRREFAQMLQEGVITLNDQVVTGFQETVKIGDTISIQLPSGELYQETITKIPVSRPMVLLFHKPTGYVVSKKDNHNKTVYELLPKKFHSRYYIGRLDKNSTGLLLLTNDPGLVDRYENPRSNISKVYEVMIDKPFKSNHTKKACKGMEVTAEGTIPKKGESSELLQCQDVSYYRNDRGQHFVSIRLTEGKNRHIRRLLSALGYKVKRLHRVRVGKYSLGNLQPGKRREQKVK